VDKELTDKSLHSLEAATIGDLASIFDYPVDKLNGLKVHLKSLASGPPYNVGQVMIELLATSHASPEDLLITGEGPINIAQAAFSAEIVSESIIESKQMEIFEDVLDDRSLEFASRQNDLNTIQDAIKMNGGLKKKKWAPVGSKESLVIAIAKPRSAALFWDRVWTLDRTIPSNIGFRSGHAIEKLALGLVPSLVRKFTSKDGTEKDRIVGDFFSDPVNEAFVSTQFASLLEPAFADISSLPIQKYYASDESLRSSYDIGSTPMVIAAIESFGWIDEKQLTWEHVAEVRNDSQSRIALTRMLHWIDASMAGKPLSYIEDEIQVRMHDYQRATEKHGIKVSLGSIGTFLDVKLFYSLFGGGLTGHVLGLENGGQIGSLIGLAAHGVKVFAEMLNLRMDSMEKFADNPVAYIHQVRSKPSSSSTLAD
jgi:hypothetical protein